MKTLLQVLLLTTAMVFLQSCDDNKDTIFDASMEELPIQLECDIDDFISKEYELDALILAVELMNSGEIDMEDKITIPNNYIANVLKGLSSIYALQNQTTDSLFGNLNIHVSETEAVLKEALITLPDDMIKDWKDKGQTSNEELNSIISTYDLTLTEVFDRISTIVISSKNHINMQALCEKLSAIKEVTFAAPNFAVGDGNDISVSLNSNTLDFTLKHGTGDCQAGCINNEYWNFKVSETCNVLE